MRSYKIKKLYFWLLFFDIFCVWFDALGSFAPDWGAGWWRTPWSWARSRPWSRGAGCRAPRRWTGCGRRAPDPTARKSPGCPAPFACTLRKIMHTEKYFRELNSQLWPLARERERENRKRMHGMGLFLAALFLSFPSDLCTACCIFIWRMYFRYSPSRALETEWVVRAGAHA